MVQLAFLFFAAFAASAFAYPAIRSDGTVIDINPATVNPLGENVVRSARAADPGHHGFGHGYGQGYGHGYGHGYDHHHHHHDYNDHYHGHGHDHYNHGGHGFHGGYDDYDYGHHHHHHNNGGYGQTQGNSYSQASANSAAFNTPLGGFSVASANANSGFGGFGGFF